MWTKKQKLELTGHEPGIMWGHQKLQKPMKYFPLEPLERAGPADTSILCFWPQELLENNFLWF